VNRDRRRSRRRAEIVAGSGRRAVGRSRVGLRQFIVLLRRRHGESERQALEPRLGGRTAWARPGVLRPRVAVAASAFRMRPSAEPQAVPIPIEIRDDERREAREELLHDAAEAEPGGVGRVLGTFFLFFLPKKLYFVTLTPGPQGMPGTTRHTLWVRPCWQ
jgi:hypothetical protein